VRKSISRATDGSKQGRLVRTNQPRKC
jgi:hypothetical protein